MSSHAYNPSVSAKLAAEKPTENPRSCESPGCTGTGEYRCARSPRVPDAHVWYCTDHLREHNRSWNYFEGMNEQEVEAEIRSDTVWQRPTWKMGSTPRGAGVGAGARIRDPFGVYTEAVGPDPARNPRNDAKRAGFDTGEARAYAILDLTPPLTKDALKARYKALVKRHHPDANDGDKASEEKFKDIAEAYRLIMATL